MRRLSVLVCLLCLSFAAVALAKPVMPQPPLSQRLAVADVVVVGRVTGMEDQDIDAVLLPGDPKVKARVAVVGVNEVLRGGSDLKTIMVAFPVATPAEP